MIRSAIVSPCGRYRFELRREFEAEDSVCLADSCAFILNNPSVADAEQEDPTSRRGIDYTSRWGYATMIFANTNPFRSTNPRLAQIPSENVLLENDDHLRRIAREAEIRVVAWGDKVRPALAARALRVLQEIGPIHILAFSKGGIPRHPLMLRKSLQPQLWRASIPQSSAP